MYRAERHSSAIVLHAVHKRKRHEFYSPLQLTPPATWCRLVLLWDFRAVSTRV
jgi:hypothetical protein